MVKTTATSNNDPTLYMAKIKAIRHSLETEIKPRIVKLNDQIRTETDPNKLRNLTALLEIWEKRKKEAETDLLK